MHIASLSPLHHDVVMFFIPKTRVQTGYKVRIRFLQDSFLKFEVLQHSFLPNLRFIELFDRVHWLVALHKILLETAQEDFREASFPKREKQTETVDIQQLLAL